MTTIRQAQRAIDKAGIPLEIVRGEGYHYFIYDVPARGIYENVSLYVPYTKTYSPAEWANQAGLIFIGILERLRERGEA
jgi:hypothetical protein